MTLSASVRIGNYVKIDNDVTLGDDVTLDDDVKLCKDVKLGNGVKLCDYVKLGNAVALLDNVKLSTRNNLIEIQNGYKYLAHTVPDENGEFKIRMGCHTRTPDEWYREFYNTTEFTVGTEEMDDRLNTINLLLLASGYEPIKEKKLKD